MADDCIPSSFWINGQDDDESEGMIMKWVFLFLAFATVMESEGVTELKMRRLTDLWEGRWNVGLTHFGEQPYGDVLTSLEN